MTVPSSSNAKNATKRFVDVISKNEARAQKTKKLVNSIELVFLPKWFWVIEKLKIKKKLISINIAATSVCPKDKPLAGFEAFASITTVNAIDTNHAETKRTCE